MVAGIEVLFLYHLQVFPYLVLIYNRNGKRNKLAAFLGVKSFGLLFYGFICVNYINHYALINCMQKYKSFS